MGPPSEQLIRDYLNRLSVAARDLAADDRRALLERTRQVIERRANLANQPTTMDVGRVLARLGDPASLVEQERRRLATAPGKTGGGSAEPVPSARPGFLARALGRRPGRFRGASWRWPTQRDGWDTAALGSANGVAGASRSGRSADGETSEPPAGETGPGAAVTADVAADAAPTPPTAAGAPASTAAGAPGSAGPLPTANGTADHPSARPVTESPQQSARSTQPPPSAPPRSASAASSRASEPPPPVAGTDEQGGGHAAAAGPPGGATPADLAADAGGAQRDAGGPPADSMTSAPVGGAAGDGSGPPPGPYAPGSAEPSRGAPGRRWPGSTRLAGSTGWVLLGRLVSWARRRPLEAAAIVLMGIGGPIFPPVFLVGATVALGSDLWDGRDKWLGLALPVVVTVIGLAVGVAAGGRAHWQHESWVYLDVISRLAAILGAVYLAWRCEHERRPPAAPPYSRPRRIA